MKSTRVDALASGFAASNGCSAQRPLPNGPSSWQSALRAATNEPAHAARPRARRVAEADGMGSTLAKQITEQQTHLRVSEEQELLRHRAARLEADAEADEQRAASLCAEAAALRARAAS